MLNTIYYLLPFRRNNSLLSEPRTQKNKLYCIPIKILTLRATVRKVLISQCMFVKIFLPSAEKFRRDFFLTLYSRQSTVSVFIPHPDSDHNNSPFSSNYPERTPTHRSSAISLSAFVSTRLNAYYQNFNSTAAFKASPTYI